MKPDFYSYIMKYNNKELDFNYYLCLDGTSLLYDMYTTFLIF